MTHLSSQFKSSAIALAAAVVLAACGGGTTEPPTDIIPPTVTITDSEAASVATGDVTFSFAFSESVGTSFVADDVAVTGGTKGAFMMAADGLSATLVVMPTDAATGTLVVTVASGAFSDAAGNASTVAFTASQDYDTTAPPSGGLVLTNFDDVLPVGDLGQFGDAGASIAEAPGGASGSALKLDRSGAVNFGGTFYAVSPAIPFEANRKTITARVFATRANAVVYLKVEAAGGVATEVPATVSAANTWETLTWVLNGVDPANSYTTVVISADTDVAIGGAQTYWVDDLTLAPAGGGGGSASPLTFSTGFAQNGLTVEGGGFGGFSGSNQDGFNCSGDPSFCGSGGDVSPTVDAANSYFFYYYQTPTPATGLYAGIYVQAPGVTGGLSATQDAPGIQINGQTNMRFKFNQNPEWFNSPTPNFMIVLDLGKLYMVGTAPCRLQLRKVVAPTSVMATSYAVDLSSFALVQDCAGVVSTTAAALAASPISQVAFQAGGGGNALSDGTLTSGANLVNATNGVYPTTLVVSGAITFD